MKKIALVLLIIAGIGIIAGAIFFATRRTAPKEQANAIPAVASGTAQAGPFGPIVGVPTTTEITLGTTKGSVVAKNFYLTSLGSQDEFIVLASSSNYQITYDLYTNAFYIYVAQAPYAANRAQAEADFLGRLGLGNADACKLKVAEGYASGGASNPSGLSICAPGAFVQ